MKLVLRILPTVFALISITAFADTVRFDLNSNVSLGPNEGAGDNVFVNLFGQGVSIGALGGTLTFWFDSGQPYFPGDPGLGPTTVEWDTAGLQIGSTSYDFDQFDLSFTDLEAPGITFPTNGKDFTVSFPWTWALDGTILTNCPSSGCDFLFVGQPGTLSFSYVYDPSVGAYLADSASFSTPEPGTLTLLAIGIGALGWRRRFRSFRFRGIQPRVSMVTGWGVA
jgi:hypothetical protein